MERDRIDSAIQEILGREPPGESESDACSLLECIKNILIVSTDYDYFILEEEGRLKDLFIQSYQNMERDYIPELGHSIPEHAPDALANGNFDIVILFNPPSEEESLELAREIKSLHGIPLVLVNREVSNAPLQDSQADVIDWRFTWSGDGNIFIHIIQFIEDTINTRLYSDNLESGIILIVEPGTKHYSKLIYEAQRLISDYMKEVIKEDLTWAQKMERIWFRPRALLAKDVAEADSILKKNGDKVRAIVLGGIQVSDVPSFRESVEGHCDSVPVLITSPHEMPESGWAHASRESHLFLREYDKFLRDSMGQTTLVFYDEGQNEQGRAEEIRDLENIVWNLPDEVLVSYFSDGRINGWLNAIMEFGLSSSISELKGITEAEDLRKGIISAIDEHQKSSHLGRVNDYSRSSHGPHSRFSRIGRGAMGGKARGLAFIDKLVSTYLNEDVMTDIRVEIPRTIVLCSDMFDSFINDNNLLNEDLFSLSDERIAQKFMEASLPPIVLGDLRSFIRETKVPLVVRSSSLLEDALHHPFAGVYASLLLPNESWETDIRFQDLCTAIKYVYASVFFKGARTYMDTIHNNIEDEKMSVIIQELVGSKHGTMFYPSLSGVAKSYDYYPSGKCEASDGVVALALGLGKEIVEGGNAFRFCPVHPKAPKHGGQKELVDLSQRKFYAVDLNSYVNIMQRDEDSTIKRYDLSVAEGHGELEDIASTLTADGRMYPGTGRDGARILDFAPMLQLETVEIAKAMRLLLRTCEIAIGTPVEIEFAMVTPRSKNKRPELFPLQVRSMFSENMEDDTSIDDFPEEEMLCRSENALGNGVTQLNDIIYVKREGYDLSLNQKIIKHIREINSAMVEKSTPYVLIGPGRWGSTDPWMGIPVKWSDIAGAKAIIETPVEERPIDPSQGSHFFHNMVAAETSYFTIRSRGESFLDWEWLDKQSAEMETEFIRHVRLDEPLEIRINGKRNAGIILKRRQGP